MVRRAEAAREARLKSEPLLRLLIADLVGEAPTRESIATLREDVADLFARLDETEANAETLVHRRKYLLLIVGPAAAARAALGVGGRGRVRIRP